MSIVMEIMPILIPILIAEFILAIVSFIHVLKHPHYRFGNKAMWAVIVLFVMLIGPIVYFSFGKGEE